MFDSSRFQNSRIPSWLMRYIRHELPFFVDSVCLNKVESVFENFYLEFALNMMISKVLLRLLLSGLSIFWPSLCTSCLGLKYYKKKRSECINFFVGMDYIPKARCHIAENVHCQQSEQSSKFNYVPHKHRNAKNCISQSEYFSFGSNRHYITIS